MLFSREGYGSVGLFLSFCGEDQQCMRTLRFRFKINGSCTDTVIPGRGLCQGDRIMSYLFLICVEGLSALLNHAESMGQIRGIRLAPYAPLVPHLLFADDSLLLMESKEKGVMTVNNNL